ncbi:MAG: tyrosine--tRNA ligase [Thermanaerothrix sp.]|uniref:tyrosine--tRNA ligase n=1 Tax=Thermanaerothrix sp. TaxID=2972675 RepID=UPI003C7E077D
MNIDEQVALLMQGTEYGDESLKQAMAAELRERLIEAQQEGRPLRVYCGYDPRKADLHLGHTVTMRKLRQFQDLGHEVTFLIGNFTSLIGDPSDKDKLRPRLTPEEIEENARTYAEQAFRILDPTKTKIRYNAEWLSKLCLADMIPLAANFTLQQFLTRENFRLRWERGDPIYLHETFYAIMQGYDAYMLKADVQVGGTDQLFNIVTAARKIMTFLGAKPNIAIIMGILPGTDGVVKMSKSLGNHIPINTTAEDMYGKVMSIPDFVMPTYAKLVTRWLPDEVAAFEKALADGTLHPRDAKMKLAFEITANFYGEEAAQRAQEAFVRLFQKRDLPEEIPEFHAEAGQSVLDVLVNAQLVKSKSEGRRLIEQKGVRLDGQVLTDPNAPIPHPGVLQVGKRQFLKVVF